MIDRNRTAWGIVSGALIAFWMVRAVRPGPSESRKITHQVNRYLKDLSHAEVIQRRRRPGGWLVPVVVFFGGRWLASRIDRMLKRSEQLNRVARQESRPRVREYARGTAEMFAAPSTGPFSENLQPEEITDEDIETSGSDDLKVIEGIGPAIARLLKKNDIRTFRQLAEADRNNLESILRDAGIRNLSDPETWAEQARLAEQGKWDELNDLQNRLKAGKRAD